MTRKQLESQGTATIETNDCNPDACPIDCTFTPWSDWTDCSVTCNGGVTIRSRTEDVAAQNGGAECEGPLEQTESCNTDSCTEGKSVFSQLRSVYDFLTIISEEECEEPKVWADCAHKCPLTCADLMAESMECVEDEDCIPGCHCPGDMVENDDGECVHPSDCKVCTAADGTEYPFGETFVDEENCREWYSSFINNSILQSASDYDYE